MVTLTPSAESVSLACVSSKRSDGATPASIGDPGVFEVLLTSAASIPSNTARTPDAWADANSGSDSTTIAPMSGLPAGAVAEIVGTVGGISGRAPAVVNADAISGAARSDVGVVASGSVAGDAGIGVAKSYDDWVTTDTPPIADTMPIEGGNDKVSNPRKIYEDWSSTAPPITIDAVAALTVTDSARTNCDAAGATAMRTVGDSSNSDGISWLSRHRLYLDAAYRTLRALGQNTNLHA